MRSWHSRASGESGASGGVAAGGVAAGGVAAGPFAAGDRRTINKLIRNLENRGNFLGVVIKGGHSWAYAWRFYRRTCVVHVINPDGRHD